MDITKKQKVPTPPMLKMALPETVYAAPGIECNIYFDNVEGNHYK